MISFRHLVRIALASSVAACGSDPSGAAVDGGGSDGTLADGEGPTIGDSSASDAPPGDGAGADATSDAGIGDAAEESCLATVGDASCWTCAKDPEFGLTWNEVCGGSDPAAGFVIEWGRDAGAFTDLVDAGDPCDASLCGDAGADAQQSCGYDLKGLEAGTWCFAAVAYDDAGNQSAPSTPVYCGYLPPRCP